LALNFLLVYTILKEEFLFYAFKILANYSFERLTWLEYLWMFIGHY